MVYKKKLLRKTSFIIKTYYYSIYHLGSLFLNLLPMIDLPLSILRLDAKEGKSENQVSNCQVLYSTAQTLAITLAITFLFSARRNRCSTLCMLVQSRMFFQPRCLFPSNTTTIYLYLFFNNQLENAMLTVQKMYSK